jgi:hypothetical protein
VSAAGIGTQNVERASGANLARDPQDVCGQLRIGPHSDALRD